MESTISRSELGRHLRDLAQAVDPRTRLFPDDEPEAPKQRRFSKTSAGRPSKTWPMRLMPSWKRKRRGFGQRGNTSGDATQKPIGRATSSATCSKACFSTVAISCGGTAQRSFRLPGSTVRATGMSSPSPDKQHGPRQGCRPAGAASSPQITSTKGYHMNDTLTPEQRPAAAPTTPETPRQRAKRHAEKLQEACSKSRLRSGRTRRADRHAAFRVAVVAS